MIQGRTSGDPSPATHRSNISTQQRPTQISTSAPATVSFLNREYYPSAHYVPNHIVDRSAEPYMQDGYSALEIMRQEEERAINERLMSESDRFSRVMSGSGKTQDGGDDMDMS